MDALTLEKWLDAVEEKSHRLIDEFNNLKKELKEAMEDNKACIVYIRDLEKKIEELPLSEIKDDTEELIKLRTELDLTHSENNQLIETLSSIQDLVKNLQEKGDEVLHEYGVLQQRLEETAKERDGYKDLYENQLHFTENTAREVNDNSLEINELKYDLEALKAEKEQLLDRVLFLEEEKKSFQNTEKNTILVNPKSETSEESEVLKMRINEYIKEIERCISQLSD